jgi:hypothetical protein
VIPTVWHRTDEQLRRALRSSLSETSARAVPRTSIELQLQAINRTIAAVITREGDARAVPADLGWWMAWLRAEPMPD